MKIKPIVFDLETTQKSEHHGPAAKDPVNDYNTVIFGNHPNKIHVLHNEHGFNRQIPKQMAEMLRESNVLVGHNLSFDLSYIWDTDELKDFLLAGGIIWDTQLAEYLMSGQLHSFPSLAELQLIYLDEKVKEDRISKLYAKGYGSDDFMRIRKTHRRLWELYDKYSKDDGVTTLKVFAKQLKRAKKLNMTKIIKVYNNYLLALVSASNNGLYVDEKRTQNTLRDFRLAELEKMKEANEIIKPYWNDERLPEFNVNSPQHKSALLFGGDIKVTVRRHVGQYKNGKDKYKNVEELVHVTGFGLDKSYTSESKIDGRYQTGSDVIKNIAEKSDNEDAKRYCELQKEAMNLHKMCNTYLEPFLNLSVDGKLYPNFNNTQTATSRLSSSKPNLQNIPSKGLMGEYIQGCLKAPDGWKCVQIDFSQLEIYVLAWLSGDQAVANDLLSGVDFHCLRLSWAATLSEGKSYDEIYKLAKIDDDPKWALKRSKAKTISYQKQYGAGVKKLAESTALDESEVQSIMDKEDLNYPNVKAFNDHVYNTLSRNKSVSLAKHLPKAKKKGGVNGKRFYKGIELLPIYDKSKNISFDKELFRNIGYYQCITGKRYAFEEIGRLDKYGRLHRGFSPTQTKNYQIQGCLHGNTRVATPLGVFKLKDLEGLDISVWTKDGISSARCAYSGKKRMYKLTMADGTVVRCSPSHKFLCVQPSSLNEYWLTAEEIRKKIETTRVAVLNGESTEFANGFMFPESSKRRPGNFKNTSFNKIKDEVYLGELLGRIASDGWVRHGKSVTLNFAEHEMHVRDYILENLPEDFKYTKQVRTNRDGREQDMFYYIINSTLLAEQATELKYKVPKQCWKNKELLRGYLRGMFDGDGTVTREGMPLLTFGKQEHKREWAREIHYALKLFGIRSRLRIYKDDRTTVQVMKADQQIFKKEIGFINGIKNDKINNTTSRKRHNITYVREVEDTGETVDMWDIVDSENSMFCAEGLVTHNTAGDVQAITSAALLPLLLKHSDKVKLVNEIHDSKWFYVGEEYTDLIVNKICDIMEDTPKWFKKYLGIEMPFKIPVDAETGDNFGNLKPFKRRK